MNQFGAKVTKELEKQYSISPNWKNGKFENLVETKMDMSLQTIPKLLYKQFFKSQGRMPRKPLDIIAFNKEAFLAPSQEAKMIWFGHSVVLMRLNNKTILIDPMLGPNASPIAPFATKRFSENSLDLIDQFPDIDLILMTHDHYDHLDLDSIRNLKNKTNHFYVPLGLKRHLLKWGVESARITEFDWWEKQSFEGIDITYTPTRHFTGRGLTDRAKSLWGGWVMKTKSQNIWFSGDGGFGAHFKEIGDALGPFDLAFMECGQYNENWHAIHMYPEESVQATLDANVKRALPVHWAGFALAQHHWKEPITRFVKEAHKKKLDIFTPQIGEMFDAHCISGNWWESLD